MKIFSNFDTQWMQVAYTEAQEKFWLENVLLLRKSGLFLLSKVIWPILWWTILFILLQFPVYLALDEFWAVRYILTGCMLVLYLIMIAPNIKYYIDYTMDFSLITPDYLTRYNQSWFMNRDIKTSNVRNIKTITVEKNSFWYNIFDNWDLIFLSEGDKADQGEITLHYIHDPETKKKEITRIMRSKSLNN